MIGTIVNTCAIVAGTVIGTLLNRGIKEKYKRVLYDGLGLASLAIGLNATITNLPKGEGEALPMGCRRQCCYIASARCRCLAQ